MIDLEKCEMCDSKAVCKFFDNGTVFTVKCTNCNLEKYYRLVKERVNCANCGIKTSESIEIGAPSGIKFHEFTTTISSPEIDIKIVEKKVKYTCISL